jgi:hypothetical protein
MFLGRVLRFLLLGHALPQVPQQLGLELGQCSSQQPLVNDDDEQWALEELADLDPRRADLAQQLPAAEKAEAMAFARIGACGHR